MKKTILTALLTAAIYCTSMAQELNQTEAIKDQISSAEAAQLTAAEEQTARADKMMEEVSGKMAQAQKIRKDAQSLAKGKQKKAIKQAEALETPLYAKQIAAYNLYEKANATTYGIYASDLQNLQKTANDKKKESAINITAESTDAWVKASDALKTVPTGKKADPKQIAKIKGEANRYQNEAISLQIQQYAMLLGWFGQAEAEETPAEDKIEIVEEVQTKKPDRITYKVQIAASFIPLSMTKLKTRYPFDDNVINNELENNVYKYSVGYFKTYEEAMEYCQKLRKAGNTGAFVVVYRNSTKIDIKEVRTE